MKFEWDEKKRLSNLKKHGIDFNDAKTVFSGLVYTTIDDRFNYGEMRYFSYGVLDGEIVVVAHTETEKSIRIISAREATKNEKLYFFQEIQKH